MASGDRKFRAARRELKEARTQHAATRAELLEVLFLRRQRASRAGVLEGELLAELAEFDSSPEAEEAIAEGTRAVKDQAEEERAELQGGFEAERRRLHEEIARESARASGEKAAHEALQAHLSAKLEQLRPPTPPGQNAKATLRAVTQHQPRQRAETFRRREDDPYLCGGDAPVRIWGHLLVEVMGTESAPSRPEKWKHCQKKGKLFVSPRVARSVEDALSGSVYVYPTALLESARATSTPSRQIHG